MCIRDRFWNRADLVRLALEIVMVVKSVHELPFSSLIGDICLENFLASPCNSQRRGSKQPRIWSVDCDSYHLPEFPSEMGRPVFSSRRLLLTASDNSYSDVDYCRRELEDELFAVALLLFQVLVSLGNGLPYGRAAGAQGIEFGFFPFKKEGVSGHEPKRMVGNWLQLGAKLQDLFIHVFGNAKVKPDSISQEAWRTRLKSPENWWELEKPNSVSLEKWEFELKAYLRKCEDPESSFDSRKKVSSPVDLSLTPWRPN